MFSSNKHLKWTELRELTSGWIGFVGNYVDFITKIRPDLRNHKLVLEIRSLEKSLASATGPFLTYEETINKQSKIFPLIIHWNPNTEKQASDFYNATVSMARLGAKIKFPKSSYNPFKLLEENTERFLLAAGLVTGLLYSTDLRRQNPIELFAMFYGLITTTETTYHYVFEQFKKSLELFGLEKQYDVYDMFSITSKLKNKKGQYQTDVRAIRNALSHFNFKLIKNTGSNSRIVLNLESDGGRSRTLTFEEFKSFYFDTIFLLHTFLAILYWHAAFATIRGAFVKKPKCSKCKNGNLNVRYTNAIYETRKDPAMCTYWFCDNCKTIFPYKFK
jgi:hypothetical protein